ncbi:hypothetical protein HFP72_02990 [Nocardiopsis sp. ARC36]
MLAFTALFYNIGFFALLAYTPFPLGLDEMGLGFTFFGWGLAVAVTSVFVAPVLTRRWRRTGVLWATLLLLAADLVAAGALISSTAGLITCVVLGGLLLGVLNTVLTESVMEASDLPGRWRRRPTRRSASSAGRPRPPRPRRWPRPCPRAPRCTRRRGRSSWPR